MSSKVAVMTALTNGRLLGEYGPRNSLVVLVKGEHIAAVVAQDDPRVSAAIERRVGELIDAGKWVAMLGGEHSITPGAAQGMALQSTVPTWFRKIRFCRSARPWPWVPARPLSALRASVWGMKTLPALSTATP